MPEIHLQEPEITYSACGPFTKNKERIEVFNEAGDSRCIYWNEEACFQNDIAYRDFKDLARRTVSDRILRDIAFHVAKKSQYYGYQRGLACMVYKCFHKKSMGNGAATLANKSASKNEIKQNEQLAEELHKPIIRICEKRKVLQSFKDNIWGTDLADMKLISNFKKGIRFLSWVIDVFKK